MSIGYQRPPHFSNELTKLVNESGMQNKTAQFESMMPLFKLCILILPIWSIMIHGKPLEIEESNHSKQNEEGHCFQCHCMVSTEKNIDQILKANDENHIEVHIHTNGNKMSPPERDSHAKKEYGTEEENHMKDISDIHCVCHHSHNSTENDDIHHSNGVLNHHNHKKRE